MKNLLPTWQLLRRMQSGMEDVHDSCLFSEVTHLGANLRDGLVEVLVEVVVDASVGLYHWPIRGLTWHLAPSNVLVHKPSDNWGTSHS